MLAVDSNTIFCPPQNRRVAAHRVLILQRILMPGGSQQVPQLAAYLLGTWKSSGLIHCLGNASQDRY